MRITKPTPGEGRGVVGGRVRKIAELGSTDADRPKLHFEIRKQGRPVDPMKVSASTLTRRLCTIRESDDAESQEPIASRVEGFVERRAGLGTSFSATSPRTT